MFQNDDIFEGCDFNKDPEPAEVNEGPNPHWQGITVRDVDDLDPQGFSTVELNNIYASLCNDKHGEGLVLECPSMEELEYYNPGTEVVDEGYILEAITVDNFSRTEKRMAAVVRTFNKHLSDSEIKALPPIVGKPKKSGTFAYVIVQLPFSDGQSVNVVFHSPEGDKKKIGPNDAIIAFRWLLNKRDITQVVAPEDGAEVSLETIAKRITQLVVKNSAKFEKQQKSAQAEREELEKAREDVKAAEERQRELMDSIAAGSKDSEAMDAQLSSVLSQVENQKTINAELEAKIAALRKQDKHEKETSGKDAEKGSGNAGSNNNSNPTPAPNPTPVDTPPFVQDLQAIISGQYDADTDKIDSLLDSAASQAEAAGNFDQYEDLFNQAADHLTELYKKKAGAM